MRMWLYTHIMSLFIWLPIIAGATLSWFNKPAAAFAVFVIGEIAVWALAMITSPYYRR